MQGQVQEVVSSQDVQGPASQPWRLRLFRAMGRCPVSTSGVPDYGGRAAIANWETCSTVDAIVKKIHPTRTAGHRGGRLGRGTPVDEVVTSRLLGQSLIIVSHPGPKHQLGGLSPAQPATVCRSALAISSPAYPRHYVADVSPGSMSTRRLRIVKRRLFR